MGDEHSAENDAAPSWCDGTPHSPTAIPPLPFHDWRYDMDNPWLICARCGERTRVIPPGSLTPAPAAGEAR